MCLEKQLLTAVGDLSMMQFAAWPTDVMAEPAAKCLLQYLPHSHHPSHTDSSMADHRYYHNTMQWNRIFKNIQCNLCGPLSMNIADIWQTGIPMKAAAIAEMWTKQLIKAVIWWIKTTYYLPWIHMDVHCNVTYQTITKKPS